MWSPKGLLHLGPVLKECMVELKGTPGKGEELAGWCLAHEGSEQGHLASFCLWDVLL